jgi:hypothetical protein
MRQRVAKCPQQFALHHKPSNKYEDCYAKKDRIQHMSTNVCVAAHMTAILVAILNASKYRNSSMSWHLPSAAFFIPITWKYVPNSVR